MYVGNAVRLAEVVQILVKHGFADMLRGMGVFEGASAKLLQSLRIIKPSDIFPRTQADQLRAALTELGPTFVKVGQLLSTRPDLAGVELSRGLADLQDKVPAVPFDEIRPFIESSLGRSIGEVFAEFDPEPIAAASLSQVYRARLSTGEAVAVKVQRPGMKEVIDADLHLMHGIAHWAEEQARDLAWMDPVAVVEEFQRSIMRELNFSIERQLIDQFRENFGDDETVFVPKSYPQACTDRVLTMDLVDGVRIDALGLYAERDSDPLVVARIGCEALFKQVSRHRLFHADPHPGNIMLMRNNRIAFIDYGMAGRLGRADVYAMADLLQGIFEKNVEQCVRAALAFTLSGEVEDTLGFERDVGEYITFEAQSVIASGLIGKAIEQVITILRKHRLQLAPRFSLLLKALATIESTGHLLDPKLDVVPILRPYVDEIVTQRYSPGSLLQDLRHDLIEAFQVGREVPGHISYVLRMLRRGKLKVQISHEELSRAAGVVDRASNRLTFGLITGSLIVGSSLLVTAGSQAQSLGVIGFSIAGALGVVILVSILRSRNF